MVSRRIWALGALVAVAALALIPLEAAPPKDSKKKKEGTPPKVQETVGDLAFVVSRGEMKLEGVGLVVGLDNTGADAPSSWYRKQLVDEMSKAGVEKAEKLLTSPQVSMVLVHLTVPVGIGPKDPLDVQVEVPRGCDTKSLAGGYLMSTRLREVMLAGGSPKGGPELANAHGPVMIGTPAKPNDPKFGRVLGGGRVKKAYPYTLVIKENRESIRASKMLETVVNERFHQFEDGHQKGVATAKTPSFLELKVPTVYHQNQDHFFRVVQHLQMIDSPELRTRRVAIWSKELTDPTTAASAAMKLEGIGAPGIDALKEGLKSSNAQVRFLSAESLAYLDDTSGVDALSNAVIHQTGFRVYALAALAAMDQPAAHLALRKLMDQPEIEIRYGAFNALRTLDANDPFLGLVRVLEQPKVEEEEDNDSPDAMAIAIVNANRRRRTQQEDPFALYVVDSEGPPLVHVSRSRRSEIVIFGQQQKLLPPLVLGAGSILLNAADSDEKIEVSKIVASRFGDGDVKVTTSLDLAEVVRRTANLGATYPEVVAILEAAMRQKNLPGELVVDAVPIANRAYTDAILGKDATAKRDDSLKRTGGTKPTRRWLFGILGRSNDSRDDNSSTRGSSTQANKASDKTAVSSAGGNTGGAGNSPSDPSAATEADSATPPPTAPAKKDDSIQKAAGDDSNPPRKSLFDMFRRSDQP
jgi:flagellar basal body P-ring protein FlgI